jgi:hypothetical protein
MAPRSPDRDLELSILIGAVIRSGRIDLRWSER